MRDSSLEPAHCSEESAALSLAMAKWKVQSVCLQHVPGTADDVLVLDRIRTPVLSRHKPCPFSVAWQQANIGPTMMRP